MSGYCPAGKRECEHSYLDHDNKSCGIFVGYIRRFEVCPWPSRQVVKPPTTITVKRHNELSLVNGKKAYAAGYAACKVDADAAVDDLLTHKPGSQINGTELVVAQVKHQVKAAIRQLEPK